MADPGPMSPPDENAALSLRLAEIAINAITEMVSVLGEDEVYRLVNHAWCRTMGQTVQGTVGRSARELFPQNVDGERMRAIRACLDRGQALTVQGPMLLPHLQGRVFEGTYTPYGRDHAGVRCVVVVTRDITEQEAQRQALATSHLYLQRTLNTIGEAIFANDAHDMEGPVRFANQRLLDMWGIPPSMRATLTPRQIMEHATPLFQDPEAELARIQHLTEHNLSQVDRLCLRDGRTLLRRCVSTTLEDGTVRVWSFRDISVETEALRRLQEAEAETRQLLDAFPGLIAELDEQLEFSFVNDAFLRVMKTPREAIVGRSVEELLDAPRAVEVRQLAARALAGEAVVYERWYGNRCIQITFTGGLDRRSGRARYHGFGVDITGVKQAERALIAARDEAQSANRAKSQFLSHMSHELRTPLNAILGFAQVLRADGALPSPQREQTDEILRGARHLHKLINDVLDLGGIEAGKLALELGPVALLPLARACLRLLEPLARERQVSLEPLAAHDLDLSVSADPLRLRQVLLNLLGNAIKYNRPQGQVALRAEGRGAQLRIVVSDTGAGIAAAQMERLFVPFERLHEDASSVEGTGIGLALSRRLVHAMGGQIGVDSELGVGSSFWIELPLHADVAPEYATGPVPLASDALRGLTSRSVLYIEDNPVNIVLMEAMLMRLPGLVVHSEGLPLPGLHRAQALKPDLILLDIQLPGMSGFEVLEQLRADARTRHIPVVAVSANAMPGDVVAGRDAGFFDYLTKPLELGSLLATVERALQSALDSAQS